jgi:hypothetical protein
MAVVTFTRRQVLDMIPEFLSKRVATLDQGAVATELGLSRATLATLNGAAVLRDGDLVRRDRFVWRSPYAVRRQALDDGWAEVARAGLADVVPEGWRLRPRGVEAVLETSRRIRRHVRGLDLPAEPIRRVATQLRRLADRIPPAAERVARAARAKPEPGEPGSDGVVASLAASELWSFRDDCHIAAWQAKGYEGPAFEVLSYVWSSPADVAWTKIGGHGTIDDLAKAIAPRQDREDIEKNVDALARRGDLSRDGGTVRITPQGQRARNAIEQDTDGRYFAIWDLDDAATARLGDDLRLIIDALPKAS